MATTTAELTQIKRSVFINAPKSRVWRAITSAREFSIWFGAAFDGEFRPGTRLSMVSTHPGECQGVPFFINVEHIDQENSFAWTWDPGVPDPTIDLKTQPKTQVEFTLTEQDGGTLVTVIETGFDKFTLDRRAKLFSENSRGWDFQLKSLESYVSQAA